MHWRPHECTSSSYPPPQISLATNVGRQYPLRPNEIALVNRHINLQNNRQSLPDIGFRVIADAIRQIQWNMYCEDGFNIGWNRLSSSKPLSRCRASSTILQSTKHVTLTFWIPGTFLCTEQRARRCGSRDLLFKR